MVGPLPFAALGLVSALLLAGTVTIANGNVTAPIVDLGYAQYQGSFDSKTNITSFLGIRFAAAPVGKLRFQAPQPPPFESGVQLATQNPVICSQTSGGPITFEGAASEDCLFLNVFIPRTMSAEPPTKGGYPVVVWIYGGRFQSGSAAGYNGADLVIDSLNTVVVVVIQYRLGALGFLSGNEVKSQGALNAGILDQRCALEWVQDYIGLFGGDKDRVVIWGQSSGADSVLQHIVANGGNTYPPLFHAAMASSVALTSQYYYNDTVPQLAYDTLVNTIGCGSSNNSFTCLQSIDAQTLLNASSAASKSNPYGQVPFAAVVDGTFIVERPTVTLLKGQLNGELLFAFTNQDEGNFIVAHNTLTFVDYIAQFYPAMSDSKVEEASHLYQGYGSVREQTVLAIGDSIVQCPTLYMLQAFPGRSWKGFFAVPPADHSDDVLYYFNDISSGNVPKYNNTQFTNAFSQSFMSFADYYDVNIKLDPSSIVPYWQKYHVGHTEMLFNHTENNLPVIVPTRADPKLLQRCRFWATVTNETAQ